MYPRISKGNKETEESNDNSKEKEDLFEARRESD